MKIKITKKMKHKLTVVETYTTKESSQITGITVEVKFGIRNFL